MIKTPDTGSFKAAARTSGRSLTQWPLLIVLGVVGAGLGLVIAQHWRMGTAVIGGGLCIAALERALLPQRVAGLLQVRSRVFDVTFLLVIGAAVILLAYVVPAP